jgi:hypothetical protein
MRDPSADRAAVAALLDLHEGRFDIPLLDDAAIRSLLATTRRIAVVGASDNPMRPSNGVLRDLRADAFAALLDRDDYTRSHDVGRRLHAAGAEGVVYPSVRYPSGECVGLFFPDLAGNVVQARHLDYHWDGARVDLYRDLGSGEVTRIVD